MRAYDWVCGEEKQLLSEGHHIHWAEDVHSEQDEWEHGTLHSTVVTALVGGGGVKRECGGM